MSKKFLSMLLSLVLALTCISAFAEEATVDTVEWMSISEARLLFEEALGEDTTFDVTVRTAYRVDQSVKAWVQIEALYGNVASATLMRPWEYSFDSHVFGKIAENGAEWVETDFVIDPKVFPHDALQELVMDEEWGEIHLSKTRVEEFLSFCLESQTKEN